MKWKKIILSSLLTISMLTGCTESMTASAEEIVTQVLESGDEFKPYYGKALLKTYEGEKETGKAAIEEFVNAEGMRKIITTDLSNKGAAAYALNDGKKITSYEEGSDVAYQLDISNEKLPASMTQKEQLTALLEGIKDTHTYELAGEEKILGMDTYHLKIKAKEKGAILGDMELWVDQKSWLILKSIVYSGDVRSEMVYEEITFSPKFEKDTFTLDLPANAEIKNMEDEFKLETGTVEDAEKMLGESFLVFDEKDVQLDKVEWQELKGEINRTELSLQYKKDGVPAFTYSVFKKPVGGDIELKGSDYKVRGQMAEYWKEINSITWDENGLRYSIIIEHPEFKMEEVIKMAENMKLSSEE